MNQNDTCNKVRIADSIKALTEEGIGNICRLYGPVKEIKFLQYLHENISYVEFEDFFAANKLLKDQSELPHYLTINLVYDKENGCVENSEVTKNPEVIQNIEAINNNDEENVRQAVYLGPNVSVSSLIEESKKLKSNNRIPYNLDNDNLFGKPLTSKWEKFKKFDFELNASCFSKRFENCPGGEIKIEKKLSPNVFTGWVTIFNGCENVKNILQSISDDIKISEVINIDSLKYGMLVGAFDSITNLYGRGYVTIVAGNSVNVAMIDYGRVINTTIIKTLPEKYTQQPGYSFKAFSKVKCVPQLNEISYTFKVYSLSSNRIVLTISDENKEIKVQLKIWLPSVEEFGVPYINFKSGSAVELLKLKDMNSACLRSKEKNQFEFLFASWNLLALYCYKTPQLLNREPHYGEIVGFKSTKDKNFVRGRIHKYLGDDIYCVKHMDNPIKENVKLSEMIKLQFEHKIMPVSFVKVGLKDAINYPIQFEAEKFIKHMIDIRLLVQFNESQIEGWKCVDLHIKLVKENFNNILFNLVEPSWLKDETYESSLECSNNFCDYSNLLFNTLEENSVINMTFVTYYEGIFYMRDKVFGKSFTLLSNMIKEYCCFKLQPYLPHNNELCLGQFPDGLWSRIKCDNLKPGELTRVHSVDFGNVAFLNSKNMRMLPEDLLFHPCHVYQCILDTSKQLKKNKTNLLERYENTNVELTVIKNLGENSYLIKCPLLENVLV